MPHIEIDYSGNLEPDVNIATLCDRLRKTAAALAIFPETGVRVRAHRADVYSIADGNPMHAYMDISVRLREGRAQADKEDAVAALFEAAKSELADVLKARPIMLSMEMRDIDARLAPKVNTVKDWIKGSNG